jgi:hypothetical protein
LAAGRTAFFLIVFMKVVVKVILLVRCSGAKRVSSKTGCVYFT